MSVTYGFYNSKNGDRRYDAIQMSSIFDGIIRDGILQHVGTAMVVKESEGMIINVGAGRAWFNHTWTLNDTLLPLTVPISEVILHRIDAVVLEVDAREEIRANSIKIVKGTPSSNPSKPTMIKTNDRWQYPLAYIRVNAGVTSIRQANITNCVGTSECPFVTAPLEKMSIDDLIAQWGDQWKEFFEKETSDMESTNAFWKQQWAAWFNDYVNGNTAAMTNWLLECKIRFEEWFSEIQETLSGDVAANLANQLQELQKRTEILEQFAGDLRSEYSICHKLYDNGYRTYEEVFDSTDDTVIDNNLDPVIGRAYSSDLLLDSNGYPIEGRVIFVIK